MTRDPFRRDVPGFRAVVIVIGWLILCSLVAAVLVVLGTFVFLELTR